MEFAIMNPRVVCQHVAEQPEMGLHGEKKSNRVCCDKCYKKGFLRESLTIVEKDGKLIGKRSKK